MPRHQGSCACTLCFHRPYSLSRDFEKFLNEAYTTKRSGGCRHLPSWQLNNMYVEKTRIGEKPLYNDLPRAHPLLSFACLKQRTLRFKGPRSFRLSEDRISSFLKYLVFDKSASLGADSRTNRDNIKLVLVDKNGMHASVLFSEDDWDIRKRVAVFTRFPEDEARNLTVDFFTCLLTASEANCFRCVTMSVRFDRSQSALLLGQGLQYPIAHIV